MLKQYLEIGFSVEFSRRNKCYSNSWHDIGFRHRGGVTQWNKAALDDDD
ncbi:hypothetical protein ACU8KH_01350 [Lachancea thermotolerans]